MAAPDSPAARLVVIGNFDGVHRGHGAVVRHALAEASTKGLVPTVLTFDPHPTVVLSGTERPVLTTISRKTELLRRLDPSLDVIVQVFDRKLAALDPAEFGAIVLRGELNARVVVVGDNFRFGARRAGDLERLRQLGEELGFEARSEPLKQDGETPISSTRIRACLAEGDVEGAARLLGRPHRFEGKVVRGDQRGRTIGFPTANLEGIVQNLPQEGVYCGWAVLPDSSPANPGAEHRVPVVINIGGRPTVERPATVEAHLLDFSGDLYDCCLGIDLWARLRSVQQFSGLDALKRQISQDVHEARRLLR